MTDERLREIEWAAVFLRTTRRREGCRCAGSCTACAEWNRHAAAITPDTVIELVDALREARAGAAS